MRFVPTELAGAYLIEPEPLNDERGFFARTVCAREFAAHGIVTEFVQSSISLSLHRGTLPRAALSGSSGLRGQTGSAAPQAQSMTSSWTSGRSPRRTGATLLWS